MQQYNTGHYKNPLGIMFVSVQWQRVVKVCATLTRQDLPLVSFPRALLEVGLVGCVSSFWPLLKRPCLLQQLTGLWEDQVTGQHTSCSSLLSVSHASCLSLAVTYMWCTAGQMSTVLVLKLLILLTEQFTHTYTFNSHIKFLSVLCTFCGSLIMKSIMQYYFIY